MHLHGQAPVAFNTGLHSKLGGAWALAYGLQANNSVGFGGATF